MYNNVFFLNDYRFIKLSIKSQEVIEEQTYSKEKPKPLQTGVTNNQKRTKTQYMQERKQTNTSNTANRPIAKHTEPPTSTNTRALQNHL
jgi:hypothetical protein